MRGSVLYLLPDEGSYSLWIVWKDVPVKKALTTSIWLYTKIVLMLLDDILHDRGLSVERFTTPLMAANAWGRSLCVIKLKVLAKIVSQIMCMASTRSLVVLPLSPAGEAGTARAPSLSKHPAS